MRKKSLLLLSLVLVIFPALQSCRTASSGTNDRQSSACTLALTLADAAMARFDSLVNYNHPSKIKWQYDIAFLGQSIDKLGYINRRYTDYHEDFINYFIQADGEILNYKESDYNLDNINPAKSLITLYKRTGDEKYRKALDQFVNQLRNQPRTAEGGFWHKKIYPQQMWLDGIYMSSPFMAQYAREFNEPEWYGEVFRQVSLIYEKTYDPANGLLFHAWDASRSQAWCDPHTGQSGQHWGRSMGWYTMALVDLLDYYPANQPGRDSIISLLQSSCEALLKVRDPESKLWYQVLDRGGDEGNYLEASASMMFIYVFAKGAEKGYLPEKFLDSARSSMAAAENIFLAPGSDGFPVLLNTCGACGLGGNPYRDGTYEYYISEKRVDNDPKGLAPFILASIELNH